MRVGKSILRSWLVLGLSLNAFIAFAAPTNAAPARFALDMVYDNPGEPPQPSAFRDPKFLAGWGYNGQVIADGADSCQTFDAIASGIFVSDPEAKKWIEEHARLLEARAQATRAAGLKAYAWFQFIVLPKALVEKYRDRICDRQGHIDLERRLTQKILRAQVNELFDRCPSLDGLVVRTGEIYLHDSPFHTATGRESEGKTQGATAILRGPRSHTTLLKLLREEVCVKRDKQLVYRTWDFGNNFHINPDYYLKVTDAIAPHPNLVFSIKHQADDFLRIRPFNPTLGIGKHRQIVEVQGQREAYGKGAHPYYVGDGVINGWEEDKLTMKPGRPHGLRDLTTNQNFAGVWTWSRGGGWEGPYITNELWCALNAHVAAKFAQNPARSEPELFNEFATQQLGLAGDDLARFRELNLLSASAILRGQCSLLGPVDLWWARDNFMGVPDLRYFVTNQLVTAALAEKAEAVAQWKRIESLARQIKFRDASTQEFVETSCTYGRIKYAIFEQAWTVILLGKQGELSSRFESARITQATAAYDQLWAEWRQLRANHPSCATLYKDVAFHDQPGMGALVDSYRGRFAQR